MNFLNIAWEHSGLKSVPNWYWLGNNRIHLGHVIKHKNAETWNVFESVSDSAEVQKIGIAPSKELAMKMLEDFLKN